MMALFNGGELTITHLRDLLDLAGWKLTAIHIDKPTTMRFRKAIAVPN
jgi:hypothetical protein